MRCACLAGTLFVAISTPAIADQISFKAHFSIRESGNFVGTAVSTLATQDAAALVAAGCQAFGVDCSKQASSDAAWLKSVSNEDSKDGQEHRGFYRNFPGYEICKAKIDWAHTGIDSDSTFSARIVRDAQNNGLTYYAIVPTGGGRGHGIDSDLYLQFVRSGQTEQNNCFPTNTFVWNCKGQDCPKKDDPMSASYGIYPPARYP
jgi:hypothetical protein